MESASDSDQENSCSSSGEDASFNTSHSLRQHQQQQSVGNSSSSQQRSAAAEYQAMVTAAAHMKYMQQQQQQQQQQQGDRSGQHESGDQSQQSSQPMMMVPPNCLQFMMPGSYQMMMQSQGAAMSSFYGQNSTGSPSSRESEATTGSPLNLQTSREDRPSSIPRHVSIEYQNQSMVQPFTHDQVLPPARSSSGSQQSRSSPQSGLPNTTSLSAAHLGLSQQQMSLDFSMAGQRQEPPKPEHPAPPKRPLTPYMRFSKYMWQQVKSTNPGMSVCEIGATIGRMWRELSNEEKQKHNDDFTLDKVRYDNELKSYLKSTGLHASDLVKSKNKKKDVAATKTPPARRPIPQQTRPVAAAAVDSQQQQQQQQLAQSFIGLPIPGVGGSLPMGVGMSMGMLPGFPQMWTAPGQQQMLASMNMAGQLQFAQQQVAHGLYNNNGATTEQGAFAASQLMPGTEGQVPSMYLYSQPFI